MDSNLFYKEENYNDYINNSKLQFIRLKFINKTGIITFIDDNFGIKLSKNVKYEEIGEILRKNSKDLYKDVLGAESEIEIAHRYSLYIILTEIFWETTWWKTFSPFYESVFKKKIKITRKSELRDYAAEIIIGFDQTQLTEKWLNYAINGRHGPVIHYKHITIGPLGLLFSLYNRDKELFGNQEPLLACLVNTNSIGEDIINWSKTDIYILFFNFYKNLKNKLMEIKEKDQIYNNYLNLIGIDIPEISNRDLLDFVKNFKKMIRDGKINSKFYEIVQLSTLFFSDEEIICFLNELIADKKLVINSEIDIRDKKIKITIHGLIMSPEKWLAKPAFDLAKDISIIKTSELNKVLTNILKNGAIKYLEQIYDEDFETFKSVCGKMCLFEFSSSDKIDISKDVAINLLLEGYGLQRGSSPSTDIRLHLDSFLGRLNDFNIKYKTMSNETLLIDEIIKNLRDGRAYIERGLKEWLYFLGSLTIYYKERISEGYDHDIFVIDRPIFNIIYDKEQEIKSIREKFVKFLNEFAFQKDTSTQNDIKLKIEKYSKGEKINFVLGDLNYLINRLQYYLKNKLDNDIWEDLPDNFNRDADELFLELDKSLNKNNMIKILNIASHGDAATKFRRNSDLRKQAIEALAILDKLVTLIFQTLPDLIAITGKVTEIKTGLEYYQFECVGSNIEKKAYGTRFIDFSFIYYFIPRFEEQEKTTIYPILITDLTDIIF
jgi:hypothetical protein